MNKITCRATAIPPFIVMDVMEKAQEMERAGVSIIHLEIGEPDFDTPACIVEAGRRAMAEGKTHYTHSLGIIELREAIAEYYFNRYGAVISPENIITTAGTSPAMFMLFAAILEANDEVIISNPHYACYPNFIRFFDSVPAFVNVDEKDGFQYRPDSIKEQLSSRTKAVFINSPANPTGQLLSPDRIRKIADMSPLVVSDEIYHGLVYGQEKEHSILEFTDRAVVLNGFSKLYAMTGWRLGYIIAPPELIRPMQKIQQNFFIAANTVSQWAALTALKEAGPDVRRMVGIYDKRRRFLIQGLRDLGFRIEVEPTGAFYILVNARHLNRDSYALAFDILEKVHVGVCPGIDFGTNAEGYLRFSYANSIENIDEGLNRLRKYLDTLTALKKP
ncbi:MAG: pyridoxal phosphate-dependent aminotransferase [Deltaproteobacteria bacterium]|nr:pyridoxal phosphate-dependent aminotransferase [Deltaproteobacteria bacterium]MBW2051095.1 pyridoxal phosphate-dependent aminotransferase [Deltaproteobacteria bacterium]MBW2140300.1 pyridoxal phosphate-dependent aminotransferase [Deltaproteobacteria bacterium]MBW2322909.1 pyridoxal phosphate-dependent aminotransferase [Deltaproteobacteria bacterium]